MNARYWRIATGLCGLLLSAGYLWSASDLPVGTWARPGAAIFPIVVGGVFAMANIALVLQQFRALRKEHTPESVDLPRNADLGRVLIFGAVILLYVPLLSRLGYISATFLMTLVLLRTLSTTKTSWWRVVLVSAAVASVTWFLFTRILSVHLPSGMLF